MTYHEAIAFIEDLSKTPQGNYMTDNKKDKSMYLKRLDFLLELLNHPEQEIQNYIHVGGTSGKGTVTMMLAESLRAGGTRVGAYTSPHITTTVERYWVNGKLMSSSEYVELVEWIKPYLLECKESSPYGLPSYFEIQVALALEYFRREKCEWVVLEVGCGGEFDATNIIPSPRAAVITNIGLDHMHLLGDTKEEIAETKSKIIKTGSIVFTSESNASIRKIIENEAKKQKCKFVYAEGGNEELAKSILEHFDVGAVRTNMPMPGRFETLQKNPLVILDVAHNPDKMEYLAQKWQEAHGKTKPHILLAMAANKNHQDSLKPLVEIAKSITLVPFHSGERECADPHELELIAKKLKPALETKVFQSSNEGLEHLLSNKKEPILITGSFFLANDLRPRWIPESSILKKRNSFG